MRISLIKECFRRTGVVVFVLLALTGCRLFDFLQGQSGLVTVIEQEPVETRGQPQKTGRFFQQKLCGRPLCGIAAINSLFGYPVYTAQTAQACLNASSDRHMHWSGQTQLEAGQVSHLIAYSDENSSEKEKIVVSLFARERGHKEALIHFIARLEDIVGGGIPAESLSGLIFLRSSSPLSDCIEERSRLEDELRKTNVLGEPERIRAKIAALAEQIRSGYGDSFGHFITLRKNTAGEFVSIDSLRQPQIVVGVADVFSDVDNNKEQWVVILHIPSEHRNTIIAISGECGLPVIYC